MRLRELLVSALFLVPSLSFGALSKTYPTSPVTKVRMDTYMDEIATVWNSTTTEFDNMDGKSFALSTGTIQAIKLQWINEVVDKDMEEYMVYPGTSAPQGWQGWCQNTVNGNLIAVVCQ